MPSEMAHFSFSKWITAHWVAVALSIAVSIVYGAHHIVLFSTAQKQGLGYHPIVINEDEALFTGPKAHAAQMGEVIVGDFNLAEYKDRRIYVLPFLSPLIMGNLARVTGSIERAFITGDFLFPPIIFLLFYALVFLLARAPLEARAKGAATTTLRRDLPLTGHARLLALLGASLFLFLPQAALAFPPLTRYLQATVLTLVAKGSSLYFSRVEDPQVTAPLYLAAFIFFLLIFRDRKEKWIVAAGGIAYGLLFYSYFYSWVWISLGLAIGIAFAWQTRSLNVRNRLLACMGLGLAISIPHWINAYFVAGLAQYPDIFDRLRPEIGRIPNFEALPVFAYFLHAGLIAASWFFFRTRDKGTAFFLVSFLAPVYAAYNMQLVTGFNVHPDHWFKAAMPVVNTALLAVGFSVYKAYGKYLQMRVLLPLAALISAFLLFKAVTTEVALVRVTSLLLIAGAAAGLTLVWTARRHPFLHPSRILTAVTLLAIVLLFAKGFLVQRRFISRNAAKTIPEEEYKSYQWLSRHTPAYSVVATPSFTTSSRLQLYTHNRLFLPNGYNTIAGDDELWRRLRLANALFGISTSTYRSYLEGVTALGGGGEDEAPGDNLYFAFKPQLDRLAVYYLFHMKYLDASPGSTFRSTAPLALPPGVIEREAKAYKDFDLAASPLPYRLDYLYYGPRERRLAPDAAQLSSFEKAYAEDGITIYRYRHDN